MDVPGLEVGWLGLRKEQYLDYCSTTTWTGHTKDRCRITRGVQSNVRRNGDL